VNCACVLIDIGTKRLAWNSAALIIAVFDGAYLAAALVRPLVDEGVVVVTRLRCKAKLFDAPLFRGGMRLSSQIWQESS
jgi:hypothetical protein